MSSTKCVFIFKRNDFLWINEVNERYRLWSVDIENTSKESIAQVLRKHTDRSGSVAEPIGVVSVRNAVLVGSSSSYHAIYVVTNITRALDLLVNRSTGQWLWLQLDDLERPSNRCKFSDVELAVVLKVSKEQIAPIGILESSSINQWIGTGILTDFLVPAEIDILRSAKFIQDVTSISEELHALYNLFTHYTWPNSLMLIEHFKRLNEELQLFPLNVTENAFRAFDKNRLHALKFWEFVVGLATCFHCTVHGSSCGEQRAKYIFRFYSEKDNSMSMEEFRLMITDIVHNKLRVPPSNYNIQQELDRNEFLVENNVVKQATFVNAIGMLKLRGTSTLFRCSDSIRGRSFWDRIKEKHLNATQQSQPPTSVSSSSSESSNKNHTVVPLLPVPQSDAGVQCTIVKRNNESAGPSNYVLNLKTVSISSHGTVTEMPLENLDTSVITNSAEACMDNAAFFNVGSSPQSFNAQEMLKGLVYFRRPGSSRASKHAIKPPYDWHGVDMSHMATCLRKLCDDLLPILRSEPMLLELDAPTYALGDIHGKFEDLDHFATKIWPLNVQNSTHNLLFLGDYVDRGMHSVEVVGYLFAMKVHAPKKVFLLRGNHELRHIQRNFNFRKNCHDQFDDLGEDIWERINRCFDNMPVAAIVDKKIFCVHGGIPERRLYEQKGLKETILDIPKPLTPLLSEVQCPIAWQILWNDPIWNSGDGPDNLDDDGFGFNTRRGTACMFSGDALERFLDEHGFSHCIRAHQVQQAGFQIRYGSRLLTVFSSSEYCGFKNEAACVMINKGELKVVRFELRNSTSPSQAASQRPPSITTSSTHRLSSPRSDTASNYSDSATIPAASPRASPIPQYRSQGSSRGDGVPTKKKK